MRSKLSDFWRPSGTINRGTYALVGVLGFALKHNFDRLLAYYGFHRQWDVFNYWVPLQDVARITDLHSDEAKFLAAMVALALPFIWLGVMLTTKRLRDTALPSSLVALFFVPFLNLLFFLILCALPSREPGAELNGGARKESWLVRMVPQNAVGSAAISLLITVPIGLGIAALGTQVLRNYGWGVFVALPFTMGFAGALIYGIRAPRSLSGCLWVAFLAVTLLGAGLLALAFEGAVCLMMAVPLAVPLALFGGICAYLVQRRRWVHTDATALLSVFLIISPGLEWAEHMAARPSPTFAVTTAIDVAAPPARVWQPSGRVLGDRPTGGVDVPRRYCVSDPRPNDGNRHRGGTALRIFDRNFC